MMVADVSDMVVAPVEVADVAPVQVAALRIDSRQIGPFDALRLLWRMMGG